MPKEIFCLYGGSGLCFGFTDTDTEEHKDSLKTINLRQLSDFFVWRCFETFLNIGIYEKDFTCPVFDLN